MGFLKRLVSNDNRVVPKRSPLQQVHDVMANRETKVTYTALSVKPPGHGNAPSGTMEIEFDSNTPCPGFENDSTAHGIIKLQYHIPSGSQSFYHQNPGVRFDGACRVAYLPNTAQGRCLLTRFRYAFAHGYMFLVGRSLANKRDNQTTWSTIPNKTSLKGGEFGFPDRKYLEQAHHALDQLGIPDSDDCLSTVQNGGGGFGNSNFNNSATSAASSAMNGSGNHQQAQQTSAAASSNFSFPVTPRTVAYDAPTSLSLSDPDISSALEPYAPKQDSNGLPVPVMPPASAAASAPPAVPFAALHNAFNPSPAAAYVPPPAQAPPSPSQRKPQGTFADLKPAQLITASQLLDNNGVPLPASPTISPLAAPIPAPLPVAARHRTAPDCAICLDELNAKDGSCVQLKACSHGFHRRCITDCLHQAPNCPVCRCAIGDPQGKCPSGTMKIELQPSKQCPGYPSAQGVISIIYNMPSGTQARYHENPGASYPSTTRVAYLPNTLEGRQLLYRLVYAWKRGLTFRVGTSLTTHQANQVTWASIHHKTSLHGGVHGYSANDTSYLPNCNASLDALNVPDAAGCVLNKL
mmetsp:Transcript_31077/g.48028  ORF Transcript_31077/g.48028 Transcript_31077/m.48028 type:complete len:578 (-) Transcript_31077:19-1752(-)